jgi:hypothetical protein
MKLVEKSIPRPGIHADDILFGKQNESTASF